MKKLIVRIGQSLTPKRTAILLTVIYVVSLLPLFWLARYAYPSADDYTCGSKTKFIWDSTGSLLATLIQAGKAAGYYYMKWAGCYTSSFFMVLQPAIFGTGAYRITPFIMLGVLSLGTIYFLRVVLIKLLKCNFWDALSITMLYLFVVIQCVISPVEAYFWYNGAAHYTLSHGLSLFLYGIMLSMFLENQKRRKRLYLVLSCILAFTVGGANYLTALNVAILFFAALAGLVLIGKLKANREMVLPMLIFYLSFLANVLAPGNRLRAEASQGMPPLKAVLASFYYAYEYCISEWTGWMVLIGAILVALLFWHASEKIEFSFPCPLLAVIFGFCIVAAMITPCLYGTGNIEAGRIKSLIFTMYVLVFYLCVCYVMGWLRKKCRTLAADQEGERGFSINFVWAIWGCFLFLAAGMVLVGFSEPGELTASEAIWEIVSGEAETYNEAMKQRIEAYESGESKVEVSPLPATPDLLFFSDIKEDPNDWENLGVCKFFGLDSVRVKRE